MCQADTHADRRTHVLRRPSGGGYVGEVDQHGKADSPTEVSARGWRKTATSAFGEFQRDQCTDLAAALTYYSVLAIFPGLLALVSLLGVLGQGEKTTQTILDLIRQLGQADAARQLEEPIRAMVGANGAGVALVIGIATALFSASGYVGAFGRAMNRIYEVTEGRPVWKLRPQQVLITLGLVLMAAVVLLGLVVTGPVAELVGTRIGLEAATVTIVEVAKWPVMLGVVVVMVAVLYYWTPNVRQPKFRWVSVGAAVAILLWALASLGFGFYVSAFGSYAKTYGSLAGIVVFLLWLWLTNLALLFGAEVDSELERVRELEAGIKAERTLQLPQRDASGARKAKEKLDERVREGRRLRRASGRDEPTGRRGSGAGEGDPAGSTSLEPLPSEAARPTTTAKV